ncbi:MAG: Rrf2 family transcriptional regulator [Candidatus Hydrogenedentes bacterium]|nr:Rrf2 family transcriptional regulator [Candidatus Hydrogenedentota bacterium]
MLTKTAETAILTVVYLAEQASDTPVKPRDIAQQLGASPTYLAKITNLLVKANVLRAQRGVRGGVSLSMPPEQIRLLDVIEACQGRILGNYCQEFAEVELTCAFHQAMSQLHLAIVGVLKRWTLADLVARSEPAPSLRNQVFCRMACLRARRETAEVGHLPVPPAVLGEAHASN